MPSKKRAPSIKDPELNRIISDVYKDINSLIDDVNHPSITHRLEPAVGKAGDIRLYEDTALAGGTSYYLQGKFKDGWASVNLGLQSIASDAPVGVTSDSSGLAGITLAQARAIVLASTLATNNQMGETVGTVARGNHGHDHLELDDITASNATHPNIDAHLNLGSSTFVATDPLIHSISGDLTSQGNGLGLTAANGDDDTWARTDHKHAIDEGIVPTWTGAHQFDAVVTHHANVAIGEDGNEASLTIDNDTGTALTIIGDMSLSGTLSIIYAEANSASLTVEGAGTIDEAVILNDSNVIATSTATHITTIKGDLTSYGDVTLGQTPLANHKAFKVQASTELMGNTFLNLTGSDDSHNKHALEIKKSLESDMEHIKFYISDATKAATLNADTGGNMIIGAKGNIQLYPNNYLDTEEDMVPGQILPKGDTLVDLGDFNRKFRTGFFAEIYAETLVAQDVLATVGGRIMVAPTTVLENAINTTATTITVRHNIFEEGDFVLMKSAPMGLPQTEVLQIASDGSWANVYSAHATNTVLNLAYGGTFSTYLTEVQADYGVEPNARLICLTGGSPVDLTSIIEDGGWIKIENSGHAYADPPGIDGAYKVFIKTEDLDGVAYTTDFPDLAAGEIDIRVPGDIFDGGNYFTDNDIVINIGPYAYTIERHVAEIGLPNWWQEGDAIVKLGKNAGDGYIELTSTETIHNQLGPSITIFGRDIDAALDTGGDGLPLHSTWDDAKPVVSLGNLRSYVDYNTSATDAFGIAVGNNLQLTTTTGFKGATVDPTNGLRLFNTDLSLYAGASLKFHSGIEDISGNERVFFRMGDVATTPAFDWSWDGAKYVLTLQGANFYIAGTPPSSIANSAIDSDDLAGLGLLTGADAVNWSQLTATLPDWATDITDGITEGNAEPRTAFGNTFIGFYKGWGNPEDGSNWPVRIANNSDNAEFWLGSASDSTYLSYIGGVGLTVKGSITVTGFSDPDNYIAASLTTDEIETLLGFTGAGTMVDSLFDSSMNLELVNAFIDGTTFISGGVIATDFVTAATIAGIDIIGHTIKTAASGKRIELKGSTNDLLFYNTAGNVTLKMDDDLSGLDSATTYPGLKVGSGTNPGIIHAEWNTGTMASSFRLQSSIVKLTHSDSGSANTSAGPETRNGIYDYDSTVNTLFGLDIDVKYSSLNEIAALTISSENTYSQSTTLGTAIYIKKGDIHSDSQSYMRMWHTSKNFRAVATTGYESNSNGGSKEIWFNAYQKQGNGLVQISQNYQDGGINSTSWTGYNCQVNKDGIFLINGVIASATNGSPGTTHMLRLLVTNSWNTGSQHHSDHQNSKHYLLHKKDINMGDEATPEPSMPFSITIPLFRGDMLRLQHYNNSVDMFNMYGSCTDANGDTHEGSGNEDGSSISFMKLA